MSNHIIKIENVTKTYTRFEKEVGLKGSMKSLFKRKSITKQAVSNFIANINEGEFIALIGPNGAGKTTLIKMLTGIVSPTAGKISVLGYTPNELRDDFKRQFAVVMGQKSQLFFDLTPADTFLLLKEIYNIPDTEYQRNIAYFTELFSVASSLNVQVRTLSLGERMKMELIAALLHSPKILFLDEPTIGLDAIAQKQIRRFLEQVNKETKTTIILTSHYMEDIKRLCKRCIVINNGSKIYDGDLERLLGKYQTNKVIRICFEEETYYVPPAKADIIEQSPYKLTLLVEKKDVRAILTDIMTQCEISDICIEEEDIANVIERIYETKLTDAAIEEEILHKEVIGK